MCQGSLATLQALEGKTKGAVTAALEFAVAAARVGNEDLRAASAQLVGDGLTMLEGHGQRCAGFMLQALQTAAGAGSEAMHDTLWMLQRLAQRSDACKAWILGAGGAEVVHAALVARPGDDKFAQSSAWLAYTMNGLRGLADLLCRSRGGTSPGHVAVRVAVAWAVFELVRAERADSSMPCEDSGMLLAVLIEAMAHETASAEGQWACISALDAMVKEDPRLGSLFMEQGGASLLVRALRAAGTMGPQGEDFRRAVAYLITSLADANSMAANALRAEGAMNVLVEVGLQGSGRDVEATMWALGSLGGISTVLEVMSKEGPNRPAVLRGGVLSLCECAWNATGDKDELARLPTALALLLDCISQEGSAAFSNGSAGGPLMTESTTALGSVLASLTPHVPPGRLVDVDRGVEMLLKRLHATPALAAAVAAGGGGGGLSEAAAGGDSAAELTAEKAAEAIGRIALASAEWRGALRRCGALEALAGWIRCGSAQRRLQKYLFWAAAAIAGLPFVANELRLHMSSLEAVDAALCTIIDILDDDIDGEYALVGVESCSDSDLPAVLTLVLETMRMHPAKAEIQGRGCLCVGMLVPQAPEQALQATAAAAAAAVGPIAAAARRFPRRADVVRGACGALRALFALAPAYGGGGSAEGGAFQALAAALKEESAADCVEHALDSFCSTPNAEDLLEDGAAALAMGRGAMAVLPRLVEAPQGSPIRGAGLKALFEVGRADLRLLCSDIGVPQAALEACQRLANEEAAANDKGYSRVCELAALLAGLCGRAPMQASQAGA